MEGRLFLMQLGTEDAPIDSTTSIDDELVWGCVDVAAGTVAIPVYGQAVVGTWQDGTLFDYMIEIDNAKARYSSGGTAFTPLNMRTAGNAIASTSSAYVGTDVTVTAKTTGGSLEVYRESIEVNVGDVTHYWPKMEYKPLRDAGVPPIVVGAGSVLIHLGCTNGTDPTCYGSLQWFEIPGNMVTG
jgi:hypothetical protein